MRHRHSNLLTQMNKERMMQKITHDKQTELNIRLTEKRDALANEVETMRHKHSNILTQMTKKRDALSDLLKKQKDSHRHYGEAQSCYEKIKEK